jgi:hypothetical protein
LKAVARPCENERVQITEHDPVHAQLYQWELEYERRRGKEFTRSKGTDRPTQ